jgi:hypothetical protein
MSPIIGEENKLGKSVEINYQDAIIGEVYIV